MKLASISNDEHQPVWGVTDGLTFVAARSARGSVPSDLTEALPAEGFLDSARTAQAELIKGNGRPVDMADLLPPLPVLRRNVFCLGPNYADHVAESANSIGVPAQPLYFTKATTTLAPPMHHLVIDTRVTSRVDWEIELVAVIKKGGRNIPESSALEHVLGYTVGIDISARDLQFDRPEGQWFLGKSIDGFFPMGPWVVTTDEMPDPQHLDLALDVNGVSKQRSSTSLMVFTVAAIIADLSRHVTLQPGDVISTGTPAGVGDARTPPEYLKHEDHVSARIAGIGEIEVRVEVLPKPG